MSRLRIGCSGWQYPHWKPCFFPPDLSQREWFRFYAQHFDCVEVNNTFYRLPAAETFDRWRDAAPGGFLYALKFNRYATHFKRLLDPAEPLRRFQDRAALLGEHLGPVLVQLPPHWGANPGRLSAFLAAASQTCRWAVEFRDPSWLTAGIFRILRKHNAALCFHDLLPNHPYEQTADWLYLRFHGPGPGASYSVPELSAAARNLSRWLDEGLDVFAFFNNDRSGYAIRNALALRAMLER